MGDDMTNQEAIKIVNNLIILNKDEFYPDELEAFEKLINTAETIRWMKVMGDLNLLFDLDPTRYKINKEDWIVEKGMPLEDILDELYEVINES
jgi:hypothetical protein